MTCAFRLCPVCSSKQTHVYDSRPEHDEDGNTSKVRRLRCLDCASRWVTREAFSHLISVEGERVSRAAAKQSSAPVDDMRYGLKGAAWAPMRGV